MNSKFLLILLNIILVLKIIKSQSLFCNYCSVEISNEDMLSIACVQNQPDKPIENFVCELKNLSLIIKLNGKDNLNYIKNNSLNDLKVEILNLSFNSENFKEYFQQLNTIKSIKSLNLSHNIISIIETNQFSGLHFLEVLDLSFNEIFYFEQNAFYGLKELIYLNLTKNVLTEIEENDFNNMPSLQEIEIDLNKIKRIRNEVFTSLEEILKISIQKEFFSLENKEKLIKKI